MDVAIYIGGVILAASVGYMLTASVCVLIFKFRCTRNVTASQDCPSVSLYKPLHGHDYELQINLNSFCAQDYPDYEIIFGVSSENDPAIPIVKEVIAAHPDLDIHLVIDDTVNGNNPKVSNLINMQRAATRDILIISDSDMRVEPDYIRKVVASFKTVKTGVVTCLYRGSPAPGFASLLGAMFINQWFAPSALIPATFGKMQNCFGATMAIRKETLAEIGGFDALVSNLADDHILGQHVLAHGYDICLAPVVVENIVEEQSIKALIHHELRWARTIRSVAPLGFASTFLTDTLPLGITISLMMLAAGWEWVWALVPISMAVAARMVLHASTIGVFSSRNPSDLWIFPVRDLLSFYVRLICYSGKTVSWRSSHLSVGTGGEID